MYEKKVADRIRTEYHEMPGLCPTLGQAQRLWALDCTNCKAVLDDLVESGFLCVSPGGCYCRRVGSNRPRPVRRLLERRTVAAGSGCDFDHK
jgi:hypothetical protein